jgi:hypothetical protein
LAEPGGKEDHDPAHLAGLDAHQGPIDQLVMFGRRDGIAIELGAVGVLVIDRRPRDLDVPAVCVQVVPG